MFIDALPGGNASELQGYSLSFCLLVSTFFFITGWRVETMRVTNLADEQHHFPGQDLNQDHSIYKTNMSCVISKVL